MVRVVLGDITELEVDVIVNAANSNLMVGGGVDYAIHQAAGPGLKNEIDSQARYLEPGGVLLTSGYLLPAKYVIHTVAPRWSGGNDNEFEVLFTCYAEAIDLALKKGMKSIAFPALGAGAFGVPAEVTAVAAVRAIAEFDSSDDKFEVILCCHSQEDFDTFTTTIQRIIDEAEEEQELPDCPICFWPMVPIVYGMLAPSDKDDFIAGGCSIEPNAPQIGCKNCGWEGHGHERGGRPSGIVFAVLDAKLERFIGGVVYEPEEPSSRMTIVPGKAEIGWMDYEEMQGVWAEAVNRTLWVATQEGLMDQSVTRLVSRPYQTVTPEVMEFLGFTRCREVPLFLG